MKKLRRAHLWIGLICSILIFMEALTGLLMNEPWLVGQSQAAGVRGNFQPGQFANGQGNFSRSGQASGQFQGQGGNGQFQGQGGNGQASGSGRFGGNANFNGFKRNSENQGILGTIRSIHEGRIGNTNIKWLMDIAALAMMFLTITGVYLSIKVLRAERKRKNRQGENLEESI